MLTRDVDIIQYFRIHTDEELMVELPAALQYADLTKREESDTVIVDLLSQKLVSLIFLRFDTRDITLDELERYFYDVLAKVKTLETVNIDMLDPNAWRHFEILAQLKENVIMKKTPVTFTIHLNIPQNSEHNDIDTDIITSLRGVEAAASVHFPMIIEAEDVTQAERRLNRIVRLLQQKKLDW